MKSFRNMGRRVLSVAMAAAMVVTGSLPAVTGAVLTAGNVLVASAAAANVEFSATSNNAPESAYAEWGAVAGATGYNVYVKPANGSYTQVDTMLVRQYTDCFRVDVPGLSPGSYVLKVVPVIGGAEDTSKQAESSNISVSSYDRSGFAFYDESTGDYGYAPGAYNADGTLKSGAVVLYVTESTKDTVSLEVTTSSKGATTVATGIQNILDAYKKGYDSRPLCIRVIGEVTDPSTLEGGDLVFSGNGDSKRLSCGVTIEGIGEDATLNGFGIRAKNMSGFEVRNLGVMLVDSGEGDNYSLQQACDHVWIHNCDSFYGRAGGDADQAKGDGAMDCKRSTYVTFSYNHFWDNGKCCLLGLSEDTTEGLYITYHHNWFDHSDSRHPRIRFYSAHVYNNYYDGNSKYGVGSTNGSSVFVENNYFENCKYPILTSMQGTDIAEGDGTFSGEDGGTVKAYGNYMVGQEAFVPYSEDNTNFDAYVVSSRDETVPSSVTSLQGGNTYNNFDTSSIMYDYTVTAAEDVPAVVTAGAGRLNGGDFDFTFTDADDTDSNVNSALMSALESYTSSVVAIGSGFTDDTENPPVTTTTTTEQALTTTTTTATGSTTSPTPVEPDVPVAGDLFASPNGTGSGESESDPTSVQNAIATITAGHTIYLLGGTYAFSETIVIDEQNSGTSDAMKSIRAYNGADVVFDFSGQGAASSSGRGIVLDGDYWHFYGFEITKAADNGMLLAGNNNLIERMIFNDNQDSGLQISRYNTSADNIAAWPSNNRILNCTAKNNCDDATMENADGFAAKLTCGEGNVFDGCMSYNNSDDGWDLFAKSDTGPIGVVTIQNCVAFRNGYTEFGEGYGDCDGNGFKLGGSGVGSAHVVRNCLAFENLNCGFTDNNNPALGSLTNCTAFNNGVGGNGKANYMTYRCTDGCDFSNLVSYYSLDNVTSNIGAPGIDISNDKFVGTMQESIYYSTGSGTGYYYVSANTAIGNGDKIGEEAALTDADFVSVTAPQMGTDFDSAWRNSDGSINTQGFAEMASTSSYYSVLGAKFEASDTPAPPATTTTTEGTDKPTPEPQATTTTTTTAAGGTTNPATPSEYAHNFSENGLDSTFYAISGNLSTDHGTMTYNGLTLTQCLKLETATSITFTAPADGTITLVFIEPNATIVLNGTRTDCTDGTGIITLDVPAGANTITKADTANLFYMVYTTADNNSESTTTATGDDTPGTTTTTSASGNIPATDDMYGDLDLDRDVSLADCVLLEQYLSQIAQCSEEQLAVADVNVDGIIDSNDGTTLLRYLAGAIPQLPYTE